MNTCVDTYPTGRIDFVLLLSVDKANPNMDIDGGRPLTDGHGHGQINSVCIAHMFRNRLQDLGQPIFEQTPDRVVDGFDTKRKRFENNEIIRQIIMEQVVDETKLKQAMCQQYADMRTLGGVGWYQEKNAKGKLIPHTGRSVNTRSALKIQDAISVDIIDIVDVQISKSYNMVSSDKKGKDTFGSKHLVNYGLYIVKGSINALYAKQNEMTMRDVELTKQALLTLPTGNASASKPAGSISVERMYWWEHQEATPAINSGDVYSSVSIKRKDLSKNAVCFDDYDVVLNNPDGCVMPTVYDMR